MGSKVYSFWKKTVAAAPRKTAIICYPDGNGRTFEEVDSRISRILEKTPDIQSWGNRIVTLQKANSPDWIEAFLACQAVSAIVMPVEPEVPNEGVTTISNAVRSSIIWSENGIVRLKTGTPRRSACLVKLTSGSTGSPKPLFFEDSQMIADGENIISTMGILDRDINLAAIPFGHSYGLGNLVMPLILQGTRIAVANDIFPHSIAGTIHSSQATVFPAVPAILNALTRADTPESMIRSIRLWISAGSPISAQQAQTFHRAFGSKIHNFYGSSETGGISFDRTGDETLSGESAGNPLDNVKVRLNPGGRLLVQSGAVLQRGNRRASKFGGSFLVPDFAEISPDGRIILLGRNTSLVKIGSKRLNLSEISRCLMNINGVVEAFVTLVAETSSRSRIAAVVQSELSVPEIKKILLSTLPAWKVPEKWIRLDSFPMTPSGKPDQIALKRIARKSLTARRK